MKETAYIGDNVKLISKLKKIEQLKDFSDTDLRSFLQLAKLREYETGEIIIQEGEIDCWIYFLINGKLEITKKDKIITRLQNPGDLFGEMGVISGSPRSATVRAADTKTLVLGVDSSTVDRKLREKDHSLAHSVNRMFADILANRLRRVTEDNIKLMNENLTLKERLNSAKE
jgi:CRP/FNR family cyclic AMP-dependent transcriptional regulator